MHRPRRQAQEQRGSSDRKLSIASGPIASASPLIKSSPVIQEGRPFAGSTSRLCTPVPRSLLSGAVARVDEVCQRPGTRGIIALCPLADRYRPRNNRISHYTPPAEMSIHPGHYGFTLTIYGPARLLVGTLLLASLSFSFAFQADFATFLPFFDKPLI